MSRTEPPIAAGVGSPMQPSGVDLFPALHGPAGSASCGDVDLAASGDGSSNLAAAYDLDVARRCRPSAARELRRESPPRRRQIT